MFVCTLLGLADLLQILPFVLCSDFPISAQSLPSTSAFSHASCKIPSGS